MATFGTFVDATTLKASELNDLFKLTDAGSTLSVKQPGSLGVASNRISKYFLVNKTVIWYCGFVPSLDGTAGNAIVVDLPVTASSGSFRAIGSGTFFDASASIKMLTVVKASTTTAQFLTNDGTSLTNRLGVNPSVALSGLNDTIGFYAVYEAA